MLSEQGRKKLLDIARKTVEAAVSGKVTPRFDVQDEELQQPQGAFVTLKTNGKLRGCIGQFVATDPLWQVVAEMADAAATKDMRFFGQQLTPGEMGDLDIEISVLSPLEETDDPLAEMELGKHGIYIMRDRRSGCFLPQVATETGWSKEQFLSKCCSGKAGLPPSAWQDPDTTVYLFTCDILEEG